MYHDFSEYYDQIFPKSNATLSFLRKLYQSSPYLLDMGCATGAYAADLASNHIVDAWDLDSEMISKAKMIYPTSSSLRFRQANMLDLDSLEVYDGIYCIGNTLVHLEDELAIKLMLGKIYDALKPGGIVCIQIINYDRIMNRNLSGLATIHSGELAFERRYVQKGIHLAFQTTLKSNETIFESEVMLYPIRQHTLFQLMNEIGFSEIRSYGSFDESPFVHDDSIPLIMKGTKR